MSMSRITESLLKKLLFKVLILSYSVPLTGQFSVEDFLSSSLSDPELRSMAEQQAYLKDNSFSSPILREVDTRIRTNDLDTSPEDYRLRLGFMNPLQRGANSSYYRSFSAYLDIKQVNMFSEVMFSRYELLSRHIETSQTRALHIRDQQRLEELMESETISFGVEDMLDMDRTRLKLELRLERLAGTQAQYEFLIKQQTPFSGQIDWEDYELITPQTMREILNSKTDSISPLIVELMRDKELRQSELVVEQAQSRRNLGFFQTEYDIDRGNEFQEHMGFQVGVNLPITNPDKLEHHYDRINLMEDESKIEKEKKEIENNSYLLRSEFNNTLSRYTTVAEKVSAFGNSDLSLFMEDTDVFIKMMEYRSELSEMKISLYHDLLSTFLKILTYNGKIASIPRVNYLSDDLNIY